MKIGNILIRHLYNIKNGNIGTTFVSCSASWDHKSKQLVLSVSEVS